MLGISSHLSFLQLLCPAGQDGPESRAELSGPRGTEARNSPRIRHLNLSLEQKLFLPRSTFHLKFMLLELMDKLKALSECTEEALAVGRCATAVQQCSHVCHWGASMLSGQGCMPEEGGFAGGSVLIPGPVLKTLLAYCIMMA